MTDMPEWKRVMYACPDHEFERDGDGIARDEDECLGCGATRMWVDLNGSGRVRGR